jgi:hypothetical protein
VSAGETFVALLVTMLVFWLAHAYAQAISTRMGRDRALSLGEVTAIAAGEWPIVQGAGALLLVLALGGAGAYSRNTALSIALAVGVAQLFGWGLVIGRRSGFSVVHALLSAALTGAFGVVIVVLKIAVH